MTHPADLWLGEYPRTLDERYRLSLPSEMQDALPAGCECILAKERPGCLSLWRADLWAAKWAAGMDILRGKLRAGKFEGRWEEVQQLGRLMSTRHRNVSLAERGRLVIPEGFREFLQVEPKGDVMVVGAAVCVELWQPAAWHAFLAERMPEFRKLFDQLTN